MNRIIFITLFSLSSIFSFCQSEKFSTLVINRPENNGRMNIIPCFIILKNGKGIVKPTSEQLSISGLSDKEIAGRFVKSSIKIFGAEKVEIKIKPGKYIISTITPVEAQGGYITSPERHDWKSNEFPLELKMDEQKTIYINPVSSDSNYSGAWKISETQISE